MPFVIHANLDAEARWAGGSLPGAIATRVSYYAALLAGLAPNEAEDVEVWAPAAIDVSRLRVAIAIGDTQTANDKRAVDDMQATNDMRATDDTQTANDKRGADDVRTAGDTRADDMRAVDDMRADDMRAVDDMRGAYDRGAADEIRARGDQRAADDMRAVDDMRAADDIGAAGDMRAADDIGAAGDMRADDMRADDMRAVDCTRAVDDMRAAGDMRADGARGGDDLRALDCTRAVDDMRAAGDMRADGMRAVDCMRAVDDMRAADDIGAAGDMRAVDDMRAADDIGAAGDMRAVDDMRAADDIGAADDMRTTGNQRAADDTRAPAGMPRAIHASTSHRAHAVDARGHAWRLPTMRVGTPPRADLVWASPEAKAVNDRRWALAVATELGCALPDARVVASLDELVAWASAQQAWVAKAPWTTAGRDRCHGVGAPTSEQRIRLSRLLERHGALVVEPWCERLLDVGVCARVGTYASHRGSHGASRGPSHDPSRASIADEDFFVTVSDPHGLVTDARGTFLGIDLAPPPLAPEERTRLGVTAREVGARLAVRGFRGAFAIDAFVYRDATGERRLHPLCEINARYTFGHVARALAALVPGATRLGFSAPPPGARVLIAPANDGITAWIG